MSRQGRLHFSVSHSHGLALFALAWNREVGVDVERVRVISNLEQLVQRILSPQEQTVLSTLPPDLRQEAFFNCWTRKEAYLKALGTGLAYPLDRVDVTLAARALTAPVAIGGVRTEAQHWFLRVLALPSQYVGALVAEGDGWRLSCWRCPDNGPAPDR